MYTNAQTDTDRKPLYFTCPSNGTRVETGLVVSECTFEHLQLEGFRMKCPACGYRHTLTKGEMFFEED